MLGTTLGALLAATLGGCGGDGIVRNKWLPGDAKDFEPGSSPNVVLIVADDLGFSDLSVQGSRDIRTPYIDSIAVAGARCTSAYVAAPQSSPSRAGILTGRHPQRFGHENNPNAARRPTFGLAAGEQTFGELLTHAGYSVGMVGKWDLGEQPFAQPWNRGFPDFYGFLTGARTYAPVPGDAPFSSQLRRGPNPEDRVVQQAYLTDELSSAAVHFLERNAEVPFALVVSYNAPHAPFDAPSIYLARNAHIADPERRVYAAMITAMDDGVGRILSTLDRLSLSDHTLVVFMSDNGAPAPYASDLYREQTAESNAPLRGYKGELYEGGIRVPLLVRWPGVVPAGLELQGLVSTLDLAPTFLRAAGAEVPDNLDGVDLRPALSGVTGIGPHDALFWRFAGHRAVRTGVHKWIGLDDGTELLFDLSLDPQEQVDLAAVEASVLLRLRRQWNDWNAGHWAPLWRDTAQLRAVFAPYGLDGMLEGADPETGETIPATGDFQLARVRTVSCLAPLGTSPRTGERLLEAPCSDVARTTFRVEAFDGAHRAVLAGTDVCLEATDEHRLRQSACSEAAAQRLRVLSADPGSFLLFETAGRCLTLDVHEAWLAPCTDADAIDLRPVGR